MKSGVASHIMAVESLLAAGLKPKGDVYINIVVNKEVSGHGTLDTVIRGYRADAGISGETSDLAVQPACIGRNWFEIEIHGKPAGIQKRYEGISGIELGNKIVKAVADLEAERVATVRSTPCIPMPSIRFPASSAASRRATIRVRFPLNCLLKGGVGTVPGEDHEGVKRSLVEQVARAAAEDPWMKLHPPKVRFVGYDAQASEIPRNHPIVETVCKNYEEVTGRIPDQRPSGRRGYSFPEPLCRYSDRDLWTGFYCGHAFERRVRVGRRLPDLHQGHGAQHLRLVRRR